MSGRQDDDERAAGAHLHTALRDVLGSVGWGRWRAHWHVRRGGREGRARQPGRVIPPGEGPMRSKPRLREWRGERESGGVQVRGLTGLGEGQGGRLRMPAWDEDSRGQVMRVMFANLVLFGHVKSDI